MHLKDIFNSNEIEILKDAIQEKIDDRQWVEYEFDPENKEDHCPSFSTEDLENHYNDWQFHKDILIKLEIGC